ncbi:Stp1/IreP family PP2C-type Ser/Thr phosphatase [Methylomonas sp. HW2-6]|uniref:Stp1/IreP family PP2C-type Ser/Thr phosphatase n=1 Tax=Methylomonas sp. HW2-6 TaxID=3376687 RepID=UPI00404280CE
MRKLWSAWFGKPKASRYRALAEPVAEYFPEIGLLSDSGVVRSSNQDHIGCIRFANDRNLVAVIADGMGGHQSGEIASQIAVEVFQKNFPGYLRKADCKQALVKCFADANAEVFRSGQALAENHGMGTTLVALALIDGFAYFGNTGDSRLYLCRSGQVRQLSQDHTVVAELLNAGLITAEAAASHPDRNVITCAIGTRQTTKADIADVPLRIEIGDCFVLCSDGLYDLVGDGEIAEICAVHSAQNACKLLVDLANRRGGYDNISVAVVKIAEQKNQSASSPITRV